MRLVNSVTERESSSWRVVASQLMGRAVRRTALRPERRRGNLTEAAISVAILGLAVGCAATSDLESEAAELRALHERVLEAHRTGVSLLLSTHQEHAELLAEQFASKSLTVTIEPE